MRCAFKLATGAGKTTVMAMLIAWQALNAARTPSSKTFSRGFLIVTPGIRPAGAEAGDQKRVMTPGDARRAGIDHVVVGRPITGAADPRAVAQAIVADLA